MTEALAAAVERLRARVEDVGADAGEGHEPQPRPPGAQATDVPRARRGVARAQAQHVVVGPSRDKTQTAARTPRRRRAAA